MVIPHWLRRYAWSVVLVVAAGVLLSAAPDEFRSPALPFVFLAAVFISTLVGGTGPGLAAIALSLIVAMGFLLAPRWGFFHENRWPAELAFIGVSLVIVWLLGHRRRVVRALRESEERLRAFQEISLDGFIIFQAVREKGRIVDLEYAYANPAAERMIGHGPLVGRRLLQLLPTHGGPGGLFERFVQVVETGIPHDIEFFYEGEGIRGWFRNMSVKSGDGVAMAFTDITERRQAELAVRESEERLRFALETCHIGAWDIDLIDHIAYRSLEHDRIFGYTELLPQWTLDDFLTHALPEYRAEVETMVREATKAHTGWTRECRIRRTDGEVRWIWFSGRHTTDASGRPRVVGVVQDVTERKRAEDALRETEERLRLALEAARLGTFDYHLATGVIVWDAQMRRIWGLAPEENPAFASLLKRVHPEDRRRVRRTFTAALRPEGPGYYEAEYRIVWPDGSVHWSVAQGRVYFEGDEENRRVVRVVGIEQDITDRKRMEDELRALNETLEERVRRRTAELERSQEALKQSERLATIGLVMTGLSHESRNALQRSSACLDMLQRRMQDHPELHRFVAEARRAQADLRETYEAVQNYARPLALERRPVDVAEAWRSAWEKLAQLRQGRNATLRENCDDHINRHCVVDPASLEQVFRNLLENALAACPDPVVVTVACSETRIADRPALCIRVGDNGPGVPPEERERLFEPFYTTKTKGTGLGLSIVRRIVEAHGGSVEQGSASEPGLEIVVDLPREE